MNYNQLEPPLQPGRVAPRLLEGVATEVQSVATEGRVGCLTLRASQLKHILKLLARKRLGTRWAKYTFHRCRNKPEIQRTGLQEGGQLGLTGGCVGTYDIVQYIIVHHSILYYNYTYYSTVWYITIYYTIV